MLKMLYNYSDKDQRRWRKRTKKIKKTLEKQELSVNRFLFLFF